MKKNKLNYSILTLILALCIANNPLDVLATTPSGTTQTNNTTTVLDGEIGEWDPTITDKPDFNNPDIDIDGKKPEVDEYFTISATVPLNMEFFVLPSSQSEFGNFFSPTYKIKNNGSKDLVVKLSSFARDNSIANSQNDAPLYVEKLKPGDGETQIELKLCTVDDLYWNRFSKEIDLTDITNLSDDDRTLCELSMNEEKSIKFQASRWEIPKYESKKQNAISNFEAVLEFSIKQP